MINSFAHPCLIELYTIKQYCHTVRINGKNA